MTTSWKASPAGAGGVVVGVLRRHGRLRGKADGARLLVAEPRQREVERAERERAARLERLREQRRVHRRDRVAAAALVRDEPLLREPRERVRRRSRGPPRGGPRGRRRRGPRRAAGGARARAGAARCTWRRRAGRRSARSARGSTSAARPDCAWAVRTSARKMVCVPPLAVSATSHSSWASDCASSGSPCGPVRTSTPANLSVPLEAKCRARSPCPSPRMFTAKRPRSAIAEPVRERRSRQTSSIGGSSESEETALAVVPSGPSSPSAVITVTPLAKCPMTSRNRSPSSACRVRSGAATAISPARGPARAARRSRRRRAGRRARARA